MAKFNVFSLKYYLYIGIKMISIIKKAIIEISGD